MFQRAVCTKECTCWCCRHFCRACREASTSVDRHGNIYNHESWLCRPIEPTRQFEETVPVLGNDETWPPAHRRSNAVLTGFPIRWEACLQDCTILQVSSSFLFVLSVCTTLTFLLLLFAIYATCLLEVLLNTADVCMWLSCIESLAPWSRFCLQRLLVSLLVKKLAL